MSTPETCIFCNGTGKHHSVERGRRVPTDENCCMCGGAGSVFVTTTALPEKPVEVVVKEPRKYTPIAELKQRLEEAGDNSCSCQTCQNACKMKPGWFLPGEAEKAAEALGMSMTAFFDEYLSVDWYEDLGETGPDDDSDRNVFVLSPATTNGGNKGGMYGASPRGQCALFADGVGCRIHSAKPFECRAYHHGDTGKDVAERHAAASVAWRDTPGAQEQLQELLGHDPYVVEDDRDFISRYVDSLP